MIYSIPKNPSIFRKGEVFETITKSWFDTGNKYKTLYFCSSVKNNSNIAFMLSVSSYIKGEQYVGCIYLHWSEYNWCDNYKDNITTIKPASTDDALVLAKHFRRLKYYDEADMIEMKYAI